MELVREARGNHVSRPSFEEVYQFPESMRDETTPVHHYIYRVYRADWGRSQIT